MVIFLSFYKIPNCSFQEEQARLNTEREERLAAEREKNRVTGELQALAEQLAATKVCFCDLHGFVFFVMLRVSGLG